MAIASGVLWALTRLGHADAPAALGIAACLALSLWLYGTLRSVSFVRRLRRLARRLLAGEYEAGMRTKNRYTDELGQIEKLLDDLTEQLRIYDSLRAERVRVNHLALHALLEAVGEPAALFDPSRGILETNSAFQSMFNAEIQGLSLAALENIEDNRELAAMFHAVLEKQKTPINGRVLMRLPAQRTKRELHVRMIPIKDRETEVRLVLLLAGPADAAE